LYTNQRSASFLMPETTLFDSSILSNFIKDVKQLDKPIFRLSNGSYSKFLNQAIIDLVKSFINENKPDRAIEILEAVGFGEVAEFFVSAIKLGVMV